MCGEERREGKRREGYLWVEEAGLDEGGGVGVLVLLGHQVQLQQRLSQVTLVIVVPGTCMGRPRHAFYRPRYPLL